MHDTDYEVFHRAFNKSCVRVLGLTNICLGGSQTFSSLSVAGNTGAAVVDDINFANICGVFLDCCGELGFLKYWFIF